MDAIDVLTQGTMRAAAEMVKAGIYFPRLTALEDPQRCARISEALRAQLKADLTEILDDWKTAIVAQSNNASLTYLVNVQCNAIAAKALRKVENVLAGTLAEPAPQVDQDWIELVTRYNDLFRSDHCGYWLRGVEQDPSLGWLAWEDDEEHPMGQEPERAAALAAWREGRELQKGWFRLDRAFAERAWAEGVRMHGEHWYEEGDADTYDRVMQQTLFGEQVYA